MAANSASPPNVAQGPNAHTNGIIQALGNAFKSQTGDVLNNSQIAKLLQANIGQLGQLAKDGKLSQSQILQLKDFADKHRAANLQSGGPASMQGSAQSGFKTNSPVPALGAETSNTQNVYPISATLNTTNPGPVQWQSAQQGRPTLTGGIAGGRMSGTPAQIARGTDEMNLMNLDDHRSRRKNTPGDQSMRRSIQDLVSSIDPNVKIDPEVEDLLLNIADEFIDSVTNFGCRLSKHRGGDTLEVRDLQLHLERNHNIRIPGFASDDTRISLSQSSVAPAVPAAPAAKKSGGQQGTQMTLRSHRLAQVAQAKREAKLI
jgi:transcription initiation factor TFIID subunit 12